MGKRKRGVPNPEYIEAMRQLRRSSSAQPHADRRHRRARDRKAAKRRGISDAT